MGRWLAIACVAVGLALVTWAIFGGATDEERILAQLDRLELAVHTDAETGNNPIVRGANLRGEFRDIFEKDVKFDLPEISQHGAGRESLVEMGTRATTALTLFDVDFRSVDVALTGGGRLANVTTTAKVRAFRGSERFEESDRKVRFGFSKDDGEWKIASVNASPGDVE